MPAPPAISNVEPYRLAAETPINRLAQPVLDRLHDRTNATVILTLLVRNVLKICFSLIAAPADPMRCTIECNRLQPSEWALPDTPCLLS